MSDSYWIRPDPDDGRLSVAYGGVDQDGAPVGIELVVERPLKVFLNDQEIVTLMTIGTHADLLAVGYLLNHNLLVRDDVVTQMSLDDAHGVITVRTERDTSVPAETHAGAGGLGGADGTMFGDLIADLDRAELDPRAVVRPSWVFSLQNAINATPSLYQKTGALHACVLCQEDRPLLCVEEIGRHSAIDMIAGYMFLNDIPCDDKILYSTGRLTHGMVIKTVKMGIPILLTRSGFTNWGVELARKAGLTMIGRIRGNRFITLSGAERVRA